METGLKVMDAMTKRPVVISPGTSVSDAAELMKKEHVGNILVTEGDKLIGIVTEQDMVYRCMAEKKDPEKIENDKESEEEGNQA